LRKETLGLVQLLLQVLKGQLKKTSNNNNNNHNNVYGAVIMAEPLREFTQLI